MEQINEQEPTKLQITKTESASRLPPSEETLYYWVRISPPDREGDRIATVYIKPRKSSAPIPGPATGEYILCVSLDEAKEEARKRTSYVEYRR